tara:strand:+ start:7180 stop:8277 length:1098 start_codon:yes stop_codon:yes gene_type:complete
MKNNILIFATFVFVSLSTFASTTTSTYNRYNNNYGDSFTFVERGVTFSVFQNGEFDFYINPRNGLHVGYQNNDLNISFNSGYNYDAYVQYDNYGAIVQVENIPIYYDYYGRVDRIGNINLNYRSGRLARLGGLYVHYNSYGSYSHYSGYINNYNRNYVYNRYHSNFSRPLFDFRIVSYKPYRSNYKTKRHTYNRDHSRNAYYNSGNKRRNHSTRQRIATQKVPKRSGDHIARVDRNNTRSYNNTKRTRSTRDSRDYSTNSSARRNTTGARNSSNTRTSTKRTPLKDYQQKRTVTTKRKVDKTINKRVGTNSKKSVTSKNKKNKTVNTRKPVSRKAKERKTTVRSKSRKPVSRKATSTNTTRKRRS